MDTERGEEQTTTQEKVFKAATIVDWTFSGVLPMTWLWSGESFESMSMFNLQSGSFWD